MDVILRASDLARALKLMERSAEEYRERMEAQKVEICTKAQIRVAGEEEETRARATATRRMRADTKRAERYKTAWIERERTEAECASRTRLRRRRRRKPPPPRPLQEERWRRNYDDGTRLSDGWRRQRPT